MHEFFMNGLWQEHLSHLDDGVSLGSVLSGLLKWNYFTKVYGLFSSCAG